MVTWQVTIILLPVYEWMIDHIFMGEREATLLGLCFFSNTLTQILQVEVLRRHGHMTSNQNTTSCVWMNDWSYFYGRKRSNFIRVMFCLYYINTELKHCLTLLIKLKIIVFCQVAVMISWAFNHLVAANHYNRMAWCIISDWSV